MISWKDIVGHRILASLGYSDIYDSRWSGAIEVIIQEVSPNGRIKIKREGKEQWRNEDTIKFLEDLGPLHNSNKHTWAD